LLLIQAIIVIVGIELVGESIRVGIESGEPDRTAQEADVVAVGAAGTHVPRPNIPMDRFQQQIGEVAKDKGAPLLLHCASGGRSSLACRTAKGLGYTNAHNLGSYARAQNFLESD
jgi:rhodanese-related sulfurtransferase